jgi:hypothetical protein
VSARQPWTRALLALTLGATSAFVARLDSHKIISSPYTYNDDIFPILRDKCGQCHVEGGVAPMSLVTYMDAYPWAESIRAELITGHMPPSASVDVPGRFRNVPSIAASDIDKILTWASGGTPEYKPTDPTAAPPPFANPHAWRLGPPDLVVQPAYEFTVPANAAEVTQEFTLHTGLAEEKWVKAVDVLPGTPAVVRHAIVEVRSSSPEGGRLPIERTLAVWAPGDIPVEAESGSAFRLPAGADLTLRVHYKKTYKYDGQPLTDRTAVGLYFAAPPREPLRRFTVSSPPLAPGIDNRLHLSQMVDEDLTIASFTPDPMLTNARLEITAVQADGTAVPVVKAAIRPDWTRRYWLARPLALARGSRIDVVLTLNDADGLLPPAASPLGPQMLSGMPVGIVFDVVGGLRHATR